jgi:hypothetical protein
MVAEVLVTVEDTAEIVGGPVTPAVAKVKFAEVVDMFEAFAEITTKS